MKLISAWLTALLSSGTAQAVPLAEIRNTMAEHLQPAPSAEALQTLNGNSWQQALLQLDSHARYFPATQYRKPFANLVSAGVGAELISEGEGIALVPYKGGSLAQAGVKDKQRLLAVDGQPVDGLSLEAIAQRLRGVAGSEVVLVLAPLRGEGSRTLTLKRKVFQPASLEVLTGFSVPVVRIRQFKPRETRAFLRATLNKLKTTGPLVIDLRESPGGDLYEALDCAALFLPKGQKMLSLISRGGAVEFRAPTEKPQKMPLVILIGPQTASAAEIFAAVLQTQERAVLVGRTSYGKCSSQTDIKLKDGSILRLTNLQIQLPDGSSCEGHGLTPNSEVSADDLLDSATLVQKGQRVLMQTSKGS